jgi:hypothetical protein
MLSISTLTTDNLGSVVIQGNHDFRNNQARIVRTATLDGSVYINHSGVSDGDRTIVVSEDLPEIDCARLWYIFNNYTAVCLSIPDGFYKATIRSLRIKNGQVDMTIYIENKESA